MQKIHFDLSLRVYVQKLGRGGVSTKPVAKIEATHERHLRLLNYIMVFCKSSQRTLTTWKASMLCRTSLICKLTMNIVRAGGSLPLFIINLQITVYSMGKPLMRNLRSPNRGLTRSVSGSLTQTLSFPIPLRIFYPCCKQFWSTLVLFCCS